MGATTSARERVGVSASARVSACALVMLMVLVRGADGYTFKIKPFHARCIYEDLPPHSSVRVEYTVHGGGVGRDMPISFWFRPKDFKERKDLHKYHSDTDHGVTSFVTPDLANSQPVRYEFCMFHQYLGKGDDMHKSFRKATVNIHVGADADAGSGIVNTLAKKDYLDSVKDSVQFVIGRMNEIHESLYAARVRETLLEQESERLNKQLMIMSGVACAVVIAGGAFETFYVGNFLKRRKLV